MIDDFDLIVASFTTQYGLRIADIKEMKWSEFRSLLVGIGPDTILGRIVAIRAEDDKDMLKNFTAEQRKIEVTGEIEMLSKWIRERQKKPQ